MRKDKSDSSVDGPEARNQLSNNNPTGDHYDPRRGDGIHTRYSLCGILGKLFSFCESVSIPIKRV